jgi:uncharacterized protein YprB with RNaseH-like and TPR domain
MRSVLCDHLRKSIGELEGQNASFFADRMPAGERWRIFPDFHHSVAYVDIETTGLRPELSAITTIALYDGKSIYHYVQGENLSDFVDRIGRYKLIVTYNGKCFDIPFIERYFGIDVDAAHIDLRYVLRSLGYTGGLKGCERKLGIDRGELDGVDGYFAVLLWSDYVDSGNELALETLLAYNIEDVINLEKLMVIAYNMKVKHTPFAVSHQFELNGSPEIPFKPDVDTIKKIRKEYYLR